MTSPLLFIHRQKTHLALPTFKALALSPTWKCYWNLDPYHTSIPCTTFEPIAFMLHVVLDGKSQNLAILVAKIMFIITKTKHVKTCSVFLQLQQPYSTTKLQPNICKATLNLPTLTSKIQILHCEFLCPK